MEPMFRIRPFEAIRLGMKACMIATTENRFVSKVNRASSRGTSRAGIVQLRPLWDSCQLIGQLVGMGRAGGAYALLTRMSRYPPAKASTSFFAAAMLSGFVTSRLRVEMPTASRSLIASLLRAVAMT